MGNFEFLAGQFGGGRRVGLVLCFWSLSDSDSVVGLGLTREGAGEGVELGARGMEWGVISGEM